MHPVLKFTGILVVGLVLCSTCYGSKAGTHSKLDPYQSKANVSPENFDQTARSADKLMAVNKSGDGYVTTDAKKYYDYKDNLPSSAKGGMVTGTTNCWFEAGSMDCSPGCHYNAISGCVPN